MSDGSTSADVLLEWERMGIPITHDQENEIRASGLADVLSRQRDQDRQLVDLTIKDVKTGRHHLWLYPEQAEESGEGTQSYYDRIPQEWKDKWRGKVITKADWYRPPPTREGKGKVVDKDFRNFINSHIPDFSKLIPYEPFYCYIEQDRRFRVTEAADLDNLRGDERKAFVREEYRRIDKDEGANRLYGMNRYIWIKDELSEAGIRDYLASTPQALALYCADCDWNIYLGKGRQAALTSTFVPAQLLLNLLKPSSKVVLVTDELETKAKEIFEDKFKFSFQWLPKWWKPKGKGTFSTRAVVFDFDPGVDKTERKKYSSGFAVSASHDPTVVNGLTPTVLLLDEAQGIPTFDKLVMEAKPTGFSLQKGRLKKGQRQVIAWGCVCAGTKVWTNDGSLINIEDLRPEMGIVGYDGTGASHESITYWQPPADKPCFRITTNTGRYLECSDDHPILITNKSCYKMPRGDGRRTHKTVKFVEAKDVAVGDSVSTIKSVPFYGTKEMWHPRLVGWLIGDGYYGGCSTRISSADDVIKSYVYSNFDAKPEAEHTTKDGRLYQDIRINGIQSQLRELGIFGQSRLSKRLPEDIHSYRKDDICELIGGLFDTDGSVSYKGDVTNRSIELTSASYDLLDEVRMLLQKIGIHCNVSRVKCNPGPGSKDKNDWFVLSICKRASVLAFREKIKFAIQYKQDRLEKAAQWHLDNKAKKTKIDMVEPEGLMYERVTSVEYVGMKPVYNLTAGNTHTYVANGIVTHNTGSSSNKGKGAFEGAYTGLVNAWRKGEDTQGTLPLFFDALCRPGMTDEILQDIYQEYMLGKHKDAKGMTRDEAEAGYYAHYPRNPDDMFITTGRSVVPMDMIRGAMSLIDDYLVGTENMVKYGYFRPIYDESRAMPREMALPFYIKGVEFVETPHDPDAFVQMFLPPVKGWKWRYFQGTDPIQSDGGTSKFASAIWDNVGIRKGGCHKTAEPHTHPTVACILNGRTNNVDEIYLQSALMGMFYANHGERSCKELVEWNQGHLYIKDFKQRMYIDQEKSLVRRLELPITYLHGRQQQDYGVDMKSGRRSAAYRDLTTLLHTMKDDGRNIWFHDFWTQLKTIEVETKSDDSVVWGTMDYKKFNDDLVDAVFFSELCARCYSKTPIQVEHDTPKTVPAGMWDRSGGYPKWIVRHVPNEHQTRPRSVPEKVLTVRS
jgi:intein/homing endonuclease